MKLPLFRRFLPTIALGVAVHLAAQTNQDPVDPNTATRVMSDAVAFRAEIADSLRTGAATTDEALLKLQEHGKLTGLEIETGADLAYGLIDVGQRMIAAHKPEVAEKLFHSAVETLTALIRNTSDTRASDKAQYLRKLALVRSNYLNQTAQAAADLDQAIALQPKDVDLLLARQALSNVTANVDAMKPKN